MISVLPSCHNIVELPSHEFWFLLIGNLSRMALKPGIHAAKEVDLAGHGGA